MNDLFCSQKIIQGDCLEKMRDMQENSIDCILTDPPYMLGFMGKHFDRPKDNPASDPEIWKEALRICKPGSTLLAFGGDRTHHYLMNALEQAGWEIRTCLYWIFGSGFPKSYQFGKQLSDEWKGFGTALKPAAEIIVMAMKPLDGTFAQNAEKWGVAGLNIDASRIGTDCTIRKNCSDTGTFISKSHEKQITGSNSGRWPSNLLLDEEAAEMLDAQSGNSVSKSGGMGGNDPGMWSGKRNMERGGHNDSGGASRFFYCAKASPSERNKGCEGIANTHPCVKPTKLLEYLLKLIMPPNPNAMVLDPFAGSGSTLVSAKNLGLNAIGIEIEEGYCEIVRNRIK